MATFEKRVIERTVRVYQVEAEDKYEAEEYFQGVDGRLHEVENFPIDTEETDGWSLLVDSSAEDH